MQVLIVGCGLSGAMFAYFEKLKGNNVILVEKESEIGGLCRTDGVSGCVVHTHGPHVFHTSREDINEFMRSICEMEDFAIRVKAKNSGELYDFPININTIRKLGIKDHHEYFKRLPFVGNETFEECAISTVGNVIYDTFYKDYTRKQWGAEPSKLPASIFTRIPIYFDDSRRYYRDKYSFVPKQGWSYFINKLIANVDTMMKGEEVTLSDIMNFDGKVIYTGRLDELFDYCFGELAFRSVMHTFSYIDEDPCLFKDADIINLCDMSGGYTRKFCHNNLRQNKDIGMKIYSEEYSCDSSKSSAPPAYPIETKENLEKQNQYLEKLSEINQKGVNVIAFGRLALYKYMNMNEIVEAIYDMYH